MYGPKKSDTNIPRPENPDNADEFGSVMIKVVLQILQIFGLLVKNSNFSIRLVLQSVKSNPHHFDLVNEENWKVTGWQTYE